MLIFLPSLMLALNSFCWCLMGSDDDEWGMFSEQYIGIIAYTKHIINAFLCKTSCEWVAPWLDLGSRLGDERVDYVDGVVNAL